MNDLFHCVNCQAQELHQGIGPKGLIHCNGYTQLLTYSYDCVNDIICMEIIHTTADEIIQIVV